MLLKWLKHENWKLFHSNAKFCATIGLIVSFILGLFVNSICGVLNQKSAVFITAFWIGQKCSKVELLL